MIRNEKGISLISLIITIIVIIILAAIVIFNGFGATESAQFAKFTEEFSSYQEEIYDRYTKAKVQSSTQGEAKTDKVIYAEIASGEEEQVDELLSGKALSENLNGVNCYELQENRIFYQGENVKTYVTEKGEVFSLPGYKYNLNGEERRYINSRIYYTPLMVIGGEIKVGDYVKYIPDSATYTRNEIPEGKEAKEYYLGSNTAGTISTRQNLSWRVLRIEDGEVLITGNGGSLELNGAPGYLNGIRLLNYICEKLYSNTELGVKARSIKLEDIDYTISPGDRKYAYYSKSVEDAPSTPDITVNGIKYFGTRAGSTGRYFWEYDDETDDDCIKEMEVNGYTYRYATPTGNKPVLVSNIQSTSLPYAKR